MTTSTSEPQAPHLDGQEGSNASVRRIGGAAGIAFGLLIAATFASLGDAPEFVDDPETISRFFVEEQGTAGATATLMVLAAFSLAWFAAGLRDSIGRDGARGRGPGASAVIVGGSVAASAFAIGGAVLAVGVERVSEQGEGVAGSSVVVYDLFMVISGAAAPIGLAVLLTGITAAALSAGGRFPRWLGWVSLVLAVVGLIPPISFLLLIGIAIWSIVVGTMLLRRRSPD